MSHRQGIGVGRKLLKLLRSEHSLKSVHQRRQRDGKLDIVGEPAEVLERIGNALQEVRLALVEATESISAQGLHDPNVNVGVIVLHECAAIDRNER